MTELGIQGVEQLQDRMQKAQESLKNVDENIKKLTGRLPGELRGLKCGRGTVTGHPGWESTSRVGDSRADISSVFRRCGRVAERGGIHCKYSTGHRFRYKDDSDDDDSTERPVRSISSFVRHSTVDVPSREESMSKQSDRKGLARNRRMFGLLLGTLQKFKSDSSQVDKTKRRQEIEEKLEQKAKDEKAKIYRQKQELWDARRKKTRELRQLETKLALVQNHQLWECETLRMKNFIRTETKPYIFWLPKDHIPETLRKHASSKNVLDAHIDLRKHELVNDLRVLLEEKADHKAHVQEQDNNAHSDLPKKQDCGYMDEAMRNMDTEIIGSEVEFEATDKSSDEGHKLRGNERFNAHEICVDEKTTGMINVEAEQIETTVLSDRPSTLLSQSGVDTVTSLNIVYMDDVSPNTEDNNVALSPVSNTGKEQVVPQANQSLM